MRILQPLPRSIGDGSRRIRAAIAIVGALGVIAGLRYGDRWPGEAVLSLAPAFLMIVVLLSGWRFALLPGAALAVGGLLNADTDADAVTGLALLAAVALLCGEALRRGVPPLLAWPLLALPLLHMSWGNSGPAAGPAALAGVNIALATIVLLLSPRRSAWLPVHCRGRWDHHVFVGLVGTASTIAAGLSAGTPAIAARAMMPLATLLLATAGIAAWLATLWCRFATRNIEREARRESPGGSRPRTRKRAIPALPVEVLQARTRVRRHSSGLHHRAECSRRQLAELQRVAVSTHNEGKSLSGIASASSPVHVEVAAEHADIHARYRALLEGGAEVVMFVDARGVITALSQSASAALGYPATELIGKPVASLIPPDHVTPHPFDSAELEQRRPEGDCIEGPVRMASGRHQHFEIQTREFRSHGAVQRLIRLRESRPMQEAQATREEARQADRSADLARDVFVATMSHELRTPLHGLIATLDMLRTSGDSSEPFQHQLSIARSSARALLKIANDVLDVTRIKSNLFTLERRRFSMHTILREVVEEAGARAASLGLSMSSEVVDALPPSFVGDPGRLKQILVNLVSNALKFTASGGVTLRVRRDGKLCTVDVQDTGPGIPADKRGSIFDPFVQVKSGTGRQAGGAGLGLTISRRLAEAMKGELTLHQSGPRGSTFRLTLPLEVSEEPPPEDDSQRIFANPRGRILVVEDNPANRYVAEALLTSMNCPATIVESGELALQLLQEQEFDLILMDCQMPGMDGYEATRRIRQMLDRRVPIIAMTANAMADDRNHCLAAGMDDFLPKPFNRAALNAVLCKWLARGSTADADDAAPLDERIGMHPDLDVGVFDELRESLQWKNEPLERIRSSFTASVERTLSLLDTPDADCKTLLRQLHTVMGSAGMVGARQVEFLAGQIQRAINDNRTAALEGASGLFGRALQRYERAVDRRLNMGAEFPRQARSKR